MSPSTPLCHQAAHPVTANRVLALIGAAYAYGLRSGHLPERIANPASGIEKFREEARERYLSEPELLRLGEAIREAETVGIPWVKQSKSKHARKSENRITNIGPHAAAALRLLIFTGARLREILDLRWDHVDFQRGLLFFCRIRKPGRRPSYLDWRRLRFWKTCRASENLSSPVQRPTSHVRTFKDRGRWFPKEPTWLASGFMICGTPSQASVLDPVSVCLSLASCSDARISRPRSDMLISQLTHCGARRTQ